MQGEPQSLGCGAFLDMEADLSHPEMEKDWWESLGGSEDLLLQEMEMQPSPSDQRLWAAHWAAGGTTFPYSFEEDGTPVLESSSCSDLTTFATAEQALPKCLSSSAFSPLRRVNDLPCFDAQDLASGKNLPAFIPQTSESPVVSPPVPRGQPVRAAISVALENAQAVRDGRISQSPCCWKGCRRSGWCNRENKHRGLCNNKCAIPGLSVYPAQELAQLDVNLENLGVDSDDDSSNSDSEQGSVIGTNAFYDKADDDPISALRRMDNKPLGKSDNNAQQHQQPGSPISSLNTSHCSAMDTSDDVQSAGAHDQPPSTPQKPMPPLLAPNSPFVEPCTAPKLFVEEVEMDTMPDSSPNTSGRSSSSALFLPIASGHVSKRRPGRPLKLTAVASEARETAKARRKSSGGGQRSSPSVAPALPGQQCTFCQTHVTPVWRAGPCGPKTLCNACGVRYMKTVKKR